MVTYQTGLARQYVRILNFSGLTRRTIRRFHPEKTFHFLVRAG
jgi:hypothetical protein